MQSKTLPREKIGITIPAANESETIEAFCQELLKEVKKLKINSEIFFVVDKASIDNTKELLEKIAKKNPKIHVIYEPKNRNVVDAYVKGFREAIKENCDFIIEMDCGFSHLPQELYKFIKGYREGYDCVFGVRPLLSINYTVPLKRRGLSLGGTVLSNFLLGTHYKDMTSGYEGFKKEVLEKILKEHLKATGHFWHTEVKYRARTYNYKEVHITYKFPNPRVKMNVVYNSFSTLLYLSTSRWFRRK